LRVAIRWLHREALQNYDVLEVRVLGSETVPDPPRNIVTWYKARVLSALSSAQPSSLAPSMSDLPVETIPHSVPADKSELLLLRNGGKAIIDGVEITQESDDFPDLAIGTTYLCVLAKSNDGLTAIFPMGASGVFSVSQDRKLNNLRPKNTDLAHDIERNFQGSMLLLQRQANLLRQSRELNK
jgi:hypothetical protein